MLTVDEILNGVVIDHITAGTGLGLYHMMELEKLHDAGMADVLFKPIDPTLLFHKILQWTSPANA